MGIGMGQLLVLFLIVLLFFGAKRLPELAKALGKAANEFQKAKNEALLPTEKKTEVAQLDDDNTEIEVKPQKTQKS